MTAELLRDLIDIPERVLAGDFVLIPKGVIHREGNAGAEPNDGVIVRVGEGPVTINLDGPEAS